MRYAYVKRGARRAADALLPRDMWRHVCAQLMDAMDVLALGRLACVCRLMARDVVPSDVRQLYEERVHAATDEAVTRACSMRWERPDADLCIVMHSVATACALEEAWLDLVRSTLPGWQMHEQPPSYRHDARMIVFLRGNTWVTIAIKRPRIRSRRRFYVYCSFHKLSAWQELASKLVTSAAHVVVATEPVARRWSVATRLRDDIGWWLEADDARNAKAPT